MTKSVGPERHTVAGEEVKGFTFSNRSTENNDRAKVKTHTGNGSAVVRAPTPPVVPVTDGSLDGICQTLQTRQRHRAIVIKSRNMQANRLQAIVAGSLGYNAQIPDEKERLRKFAEATELINRVNNGEQLSPLDEIIRATMLGVNTFNVMIKQLDNIIKDNAKLLPVASWVEAPSQRGFSFLFLGEVVGEAGNLFNYANPAKLWKRMGCAPHTFDGRTMMGASWRKNKGLPKEEWMNYGYSPRRRSIAYLIGKNIVMQNGAKTVGGVDKPCGPYRKRYDEAKVKVKEDHPDYSDKHCDLHAMLLATKLLLKNLWLEWWQYPPEIRNY